MADKEAIKAEVLSRLANGSPVRKLPKSKAQIGNVVVHIRFRSEAKGGGAVWSFNLNPNTLSADFELWICGAPNRYYVVPISEVREMYDAPGAYVDQAHPEIRVVDINSQTHECIYGRNDLRRDVSAYFRAGLS